MIEILYGPDGVGKSTVAQALSVQEPDSLLLHGTNFNSWFAEYPLEMRDHGFDPSIVPPDEAFLDKMAVLNEVALVLARQHKVVVDGHALHKTAINVMAGRSRLSGISTRSHSADELIAGPLNAAVLPLLGSAATHTLVVLGKSELPPQANPAYILQQRLGERGDISPWDPQTTRESWSQLIAGYELHFALERLGALVAERTSTKPVLG